MDRATVTRDYLTHPHLKAFENWIQAGDSLLMEELWETPKALLLSLAQKATQKHIVILSGGQREQRLLDDLAYFLGQEPLEFPAWETLPSEDLPPSPDIVGERFHLLRKIEESSSPLVVVTSLQACLQRLLPKEKLKPLHLHIKKGSKIEMDDLLKHLPLMGYHRKAIAADKGEFAIRGGIIDLFPVSSPDPVRIEFWEDGIESLRYYDPISQVSTQRCEEILVTPAEELELISKQEQLATLFDYLGPQTLLVFDDLLAIEDKYATLKESLESQGRHFISLNELLKMTSSLQKLYFSESPLEELSEIKLLDKEKRNPYALGQPPQSIGFQFFHHDLQAKRWRHPFLPLLPTFCPPEIPLEEFSSEAFLQTISQAPLSIQFLFTSEAEQKLFAQKLENQTPPPKATFSFEQGYLSSGFLLQDPSFALLPSTELTHRYRVRRQKQRTASQALPLELMALSPGEAVVHLNSGIGRFVGIEKRPNHLGVETEYMILEYAEGSHLYVPIEQANLISKYIGSTEEPPKLHALGSTQWKRTRERTEKAIQGYASDLLKLQAERVVKGGFVYPSDSDLTRQFEEEFPYQETPDQKKAIEDSRKDMMSEKPMDRLVCGDVGYGKTEVAMRAAFKAVVDGGKQVAVLVPTTVLAMQHYDTFRARMANFPIQVGILSRFRTPKQIQETLRQVTEGSIDIVIGTHRIVSKDVTFKELGLIIIDEEQRFGVRAKEHLKQLKKDVDCLTLSATPIPRTLYLSLVGARDLSVINTPPEDRLPIQTVVCQGNDDILKNALLRELSRDGQAYVIHNRVETIYQTADRIRTLVPGARIVVGHGQMSADELDAVFHAFKTGQADILVSTSIIENGIDIPNANTILVERADRFGLADLYQIRGRVGRWNKKAYCYFFVPNTRELSEISRKRLAALAQSSGHGGGMKVAMHDLEIRGAGNILGTEQSGHVAAIGFHLYCKLLKKTIEAMKTNTAPTIASEVKIEFPYDARLPETYIDDVHLRLDLYQRIGDAENEGDLSRLFEEIKDRFGESPPQVKWLHHIARIRLFASRHHFTVLKLSKAIFFAEQEHGKKNKISKKLLFATPQTPEELEEKVIAALKAHFPLR